MIDPAKHLLTVAQGRYQAALDDLGRAEREADERLAIAEANAAAAETQVTIAWRALSLSRQANACLCSGCDHWHPISAFVPTMSGPACVDCAAAQGAHDGA